MFTTADRNPPHVHPRYEDGHYLFPITCRTRTSPYIWNFKYAYQIRNRVTKKPKRKW